MRKRHSAPVVGMGRRSKGMAMTPHKFSGSSMTTLYLLTSLVCSVWFIQAVYDAYQRHQLFYWPNVVFFVCMIGVIAGTSYQAMHVGHTGKMPHEEDGRS